MGSIFSKEKFYILLGSDDLPKVYLPYFDYSPELFYVHHGYVSEVKRNNMTISAWNPYHMGNFRVAARNRFKSVDGIIFLVDSKATDLKLTEMHDIFHQTLWDLPKDCRNCPILLVCINRNGINTGDPIPIEGIQHKLGFYRSMLEPADKYDIQANSMLSYLSDETLNLIFEFAKHWENGISVKYTPYLFQNANIAFFDEFFGTKQEIENLEWHVYDDYDHIFQIICDFLPVYKYNDKPPEQYIAESISSFGEFSMISRDFIDVKRKFW